MEIFSTRMRVCHHPTIFSYDETSMRDDPEAQECFFKQGVRYLEQIKDHNKMAFSTMFCASGGGELTPTMIVLKSPSGNFHDT